MPEIVTEKLYKRALLLAALTVAYNIAEGLISVFFGVQDDTLALLGFGVDSFIEVISGFGILHMIIRMRNSGQSNNDTFERQALRITGFSFYLLFAGLTAGSIINLVNSNVPRTTVPGIIISLISLITMYFLMNAKLRTGKALNSHAIIADANCTKTCFYLSLILLASSGLYELFGAVYFDAVGSLGIAYMAFREGKEAFEKAASENLTCGCGSDCSNSQPK